MYRELVSTLGVVRTPLERAFSSILVDRGWIEPVDLLEAASEAGQRRVAGETADMAMVLRERGTLPADRIDDALAALGELPVRCPDCGETTTVATWDPLHAVVCPTDGTTMQPTLGTDADPAPARSTAGGAAAGPEASSSSRERPSGSGVYVDEYRMTRTLATTGMSMLSLFEAPDGSDRVVVKTLIRETGATARRLEREFRLAERVDHPNVVRIREVGTLFDVLYIAMDYVDAPSLQDLVNDRGPLPLDTARDVIAGLLAGLGALHAVGVVHRDIKPSNVLADGKGLVRVIDLGIAADRTGELSRLTGTGDFIGTPAYTAPEQLVSSEVDHRADLYSAGLTAYYILTGQQPFSGTEVGTMLVERRNVNELPPVTDARPDVPDAVEGVIRQLLEFDPDDRIPTADQAAARFAAAFGSAD